MPVFFLYFSSKLSLQEVLLLESVYYMSVVILEVPTGYFSDLVGRRLTLVIGAAALIVACLLYLYGDNFMILALGQVGFAVHMAFISGTNTVFHYESLLADQKDSEYGDREATVNKYGSIAGGTAALIGGYLATSNLSLAYVISLVAGAIAMIIAIGFIEPPRPSDKVSSSKSIFAQLKTTFSFLKLKPLGWLAAYFIIFYCITHVPYEFYQPYIQILSDQGLLYGYSVPMISGIIYATARYVSAIGAGYSMIWSRKLGIYNFLSLCIITITAVVVVISSMLHVIALGFVLLRSTPWMAIKAPINAIITPRIDAGQRATYHSVISLLCRLSFFIVLFGLSLVVDHGDILNWESLSLILHITVIGSLALMIPLLIMGKSHINSRS